MIMGVIGWAGYSHSDSGWQWVRMGAWGLHCCTVGNSQSAPGLCAGAVVSHQVLWAYLSPGPGRVLLGWWVRVHAARSNMDTGGWWWSLSGDCGAYLSRGSRDTWLIGGCTCRKDTTMFNKLSRATGAACATLSTATLRYVHLPCCIEGYDKVGHGNGEK